MPLQQWRTIWADPLKDVVEVGFFCIGVGAFTLHNLLTSVGCEGVDDVVTRGLCRPCTSL